MDKKTLAGQLEYAADLMEVIGENDFRAKAYRNAARGVEKAEPELAELIANGFKGVPGVGTSLAPVLVEVAQTGEFAYITELEQTLPPGVLDFFRVGGLGPKRIRALWQNHVTGLEDLVEKCEAGKIRSISGFGAKTEISLMLAARYALDNLRRANLPTGQEAAHYIVVDLANAGIRSEIAGSVRRGLETVGNIDIVAVGKPEAILAAVGGFAERIEGDSVLGEVSGLGLRIRCADAENFGSEVFRAVGSEAWLEGKEIPTNCATEDEVFEKMGVSRVPRFWREPEHKGLTPPERFLNEGDLQGLIHNHTTFSDGTGSLRQMAEAALTFGYQYIVISDHSQSAVYAGGLKVEDLERQWAEIDQLNVEMAPFRILKGIESDILSDGSLDYPDEVLARFDVVIGSLHSNLSLEREKQTARLVKAVSNPYLTILGHPSGRILLRRKGADADWDLVLKTAQEHGKIVEFNCHPARLDLDWRLMLEWRDRLNFSLGPDSHSLEGIEMIQYGIHFAQKAGLSVGQVVNTWDADRLIAIKKGL